MLQEKLFWEGAWACLCHVSVWEWPMGWTHSWILPPELVGWVWDGIITVSRHWHFGSAEFPVSGYIPEWCLIYLCRLSSPSEYRKDHYIVEALSSWTFNAWNPFLHFSAVREKREQDSFPFLFILLCIWRQLQSLTPVSFRLNNLSFFHIFLAGHVF